MQRKKNNIKQLEKLGVVISRPYTKQTPEALYRNRVKYYKSHKEKVHQLQKDYIRREAAKEYSPYLNHRREHARAYYYEKAKTSPEAMEKQRIRAKLAYSKTNYC